MALTGCAKKKAHRRTSDHEGDPLGGKTAPLTAGMEAPEGKTPCETSWNAVSALDETARKDKIPPPWAHLPDRETFLAACNAVAPNDQICLQPRYQMAHQDDCAPVLKRLMESDPAGLKFYEMLK